MPGIRPRNIAGLKFNRWTALSRTIKSKHGYWQWLCICECGTKREVPISYLRQGSSKSRGCLKLEKLKEGHRHTEETKNKLSSAKKGDKNPAWKGGITSERSLIYHSREYQDWRKSVFERDNYTCQNCRAKSGDGIAVVLNADHIQPYAYFPELRFDIKNGRTLCIGCHKKTNTFGGKAVTYYKLMNKQTTN